MTQSATCLKAFLSQTLRSLLLLLTCVFLLAACDSRHAPGRGASLRLPEGALQDAKSGDPFARIVVGVAYLDAGQNEIGMEWLRLATEQQISQEAALKGMEVLGYYHYSLQELGEAAKWFKLAAQTGDAESQFRLGTFLWSGKILPSDKEQSAAWLLKAAEQSHPKAAYLTGQNYLFGYGITRNDAEALRWFRVASCQGIKEAEWELACLLTAGQGVQTNVVEAVGHFRNAAIDGHTQAQVILGYIYYSGEHVPQNHSAAREWFSKAAESGSAEAQNNLGWFLEDGTGGVENRAAAVEWYRKSANQGLREAKWNLGLCYVYGIGVKPNYAEAVRWVGQAAAAGDPEAKVLLDELRSIWISTQNTEAIVGRGFGVRNGSYYGEPNANGIRKTVFVRSYLRGDGTHVESHFRSPPNSNLYRGRRY
jgi:TPR repeat protein